METTIPVVASFASLLAVIEANGVFKSNSPEKKSLRNITSHYNYELAGKDSKSKKNNKRRKWDNRINAEEGMPNMMRKVSTHILDLQIDEPFRSYLQIFDLFQNRFKIRSPKQEVESTRFQLIQQKCSIIHEELERNPKLLPLIIQTLNSFVSPLKELPTMEGIDQELKYLCQLLEVEYPSMLFHANGILPPLQDQLLDELLKEIPRKNNLGEGQKLDNLTEHILRQLEETPDSNLLKERQLEETPDSNLLKDFILNPKREEAALLSFGYLISMLKEPLWELKDEEGNSLLGGENELNEAINSPLCLQFLQHCECPWDYFKRDIIHLAEDRMRQAQYTRMRDYLECPEDFRVEPRISEALLSQLKKYLILFHEKGILPRSDWQVPRLIFHKL